MRIRTKLTIAVLAAMALVAAAAGLIIRAASERNVRIFAEASMRAARGAFEGTERGEVEKLTATLAAIAADARYRRPFLAGDRAGLAALAEPLFRDLKAHGVTHWYFHLPDRSCFLRVHRPDLHGDSVDRPMLAKAAGGRVAAGMELGMTAFALRAVQPWYVDGELIGFIELGEETQGFLAHMKEHTGDDYALQIEKRHLDRARFAEVRREAGLRDDWEDLPTSVVIDATATGPTMQPWNGAPALLPPEGAYLGMGAEGGRTWARGAFPVADASGHRVGALTVRSDVTLFRDNIASARRKVILLVVGLAAVVALLLAWVVDRLVLARLRRTTALLEDVSARLVGGDYDLANAVPPPAAQDEIGSFEAFFGRFIAVVAETLDGLTRRRR